MKKRTISIIIIMCLLSLGIVSLYTTFAYNEENTKLDNSTADHNLIYSLKETTSKQIIVSQNEVKFVDITLENPYTSTIKYGMYYYMISPVTTPNGFTASLSEDSQDVLTNIIKPSQTRTVSIKLTNNSTQQVEIILGALVGFEKGKIEDHVQNGEVLIK